MSFTEQTEQFATDVTQDFRWEHEEIFRRVFDDGPMGMAIVGPESQFVKANRNLCEMFGYSEEELTARSLIDVTHPEDKKTGADLIEKVVGGASPSYRVKMRCVAKSGNVVWIRLTAAVIRDRDGGITYGLAMIEDLSERKRAERILRTIVEGTSSVVGVDFFRSLVRNLAQALDVRYTVVAECLDYPPRRVRTLAYWADDGFVDNVEYDVRGTPCESVSAGKEVFHPQDVQRLFPADEVLVELNADSYCGIPLWDCDGRVLGHFAIMDDRPMPNTLPTSPALRIFAARAAAELDRKRTEQVLRQSERLASIGTLAAGIAHEINNPLNAIVSAAGALRRGDTADREFVEECLVTIKSAALRAGEITHGILRFAQQEVAARTPSDVALIAERARQMALPLANDREVEIRIGQATASPKVVCNATEIEQVIFNLLSNAIEASDAGAHVQLRLNRQGRIAVVSVQDFGIGMTPEQIGSIFDPFYTTRQAGGWSRPRSEHHARHCQPAWRNDRRAEFTGRGIDHQRDIASRLTRSRSARPTEIGRTSAVSNSAGRDSSPAAACE